MNGHRATSAFALYNNLKRLTRDLDHTLNMIAQLAEPSASTGITTDGLYTDVDAARRLLEQTWCQLEYLQLQRRVERKNRPRLKRGPKPRRPK